MSTEQTLVIVTLKAERVGREAAGRPRSPLHEHVVLVLIVIIGTQFVLAVRPAVDTALHREVLRMFPVRNLNIS